ncbi:hypothetical protein OKW45_005245 [Paraburkholderia sp. WSM4175]
MQLKSQATIWLSIFSMAHGVSDVPGYGLGMAPHFDDGRLH